MVFTLVVFYNGLNFFSFSLRELVGFKRFISLFEFARKSQIFGLIF